MALKPPKPLVFSEEENVMGPENVLLLTKFIPHYSDIIQPLRELLKKNNEFSWTIEQDKAFKDLKSALSSAPSLGFYDVTKPVTLSVDSSQHSIGAVLLQDKPIAYATRSL